MLNGVKTNAEKENLRNITNFSANIILDAKTRYLSCLGNKLNNPQLGPKAFFFFFFFSICFRCPTSYERAKNTRLHR